MRIYTHIILFLLGNLLTLKSYSQNYIVQYNYNDISFSTSKGYDVISLPDCYYTDIVGSPMLPMKELKYIIPSNKEVLNIKIINKTEVEISGDYTIFPAQPPQLQSQAPPTFVNPDQSFYNTNTNFPYNPFMEMESGFMAGSRIFCVKYCPVQYNPVTKKLKLITRIEFSFEYKNDVKEFTVSSNLSKLSYLNLSNNIKNITANPLEYETLRSSEAVATSSSSPENIDYVIITNNELSSGFQDIADWKMKKGLRTKIITTEWISTSFSGVDMPDKIRNFIKYAFQHWGSIWFLMGGDTDIVPMRQVWHSSQGDVPDKFFPTDMYYACLDGNWNADSDMTFGEGNYDRTNDGSYQFKDYDVDQVDRFYDVFVGRIPIKNIEELNN